MSRIRRHLNYANVAATMALVIAIGGTTTAIAVNKAPKNSVVSASIKPFNVAAGDLAGIRTVQVTSSFRAVATCSPHERLFGGGGVATGGVRTSAPQGNGWSVERDDGQNQPVVAYALCLKGKPGK